LAHFPDIYLIDPKCAMCPDGVNIASYCSHTLEEAHLMGLCIPTFKGKGQDLGRWIIDDKIAALNSCSGNTQIKSARQALRCVIKEDILTWE